MTTLIEIGPVPRLETPCVDTLPAALAAGVFLRQLNRARPLIPESAARYILTQRDRGNKPWITVQLSVSVNSWPTAELAHDIASAACEIDHWDDQAQRELREYGITSQQAHGQLAMAI